MKPQTSDKTTSRATDISSSDFGPFHGECKAPGGKLVVVEFAVRDGDLAEVQITGDFFLFPEDALSRLCASLEGTSGLASADERAARLQDSLTEGDELIGLTSHAIALAVERAISEHR